MQEITLADDVKPYLEWVNNRILPKVGKTLPQGFAQGSIGAAWVNGPTHAGSAW
jgi:hypothetical protein